jgi:MFS family permease
VVTGYTLTFSALILFAGTLSDRIGARRAWGIGMVLFAAASAVCGLARLGTLIGARLLQGAGAALVTPTSLALIRDVSRAGASPRREVPFDFVGQVSAIAALGSSSYVVIEDANHGSSSPLIIGLLIVAALSGVVFFAAQARGGIRWSR